LRFGSHEAERLRQALAEARDDEELRILLIEKHRLLRLCAGERYERLDQPGGICREIVPAQTIARGTRIERRNARPRRHRAGNAGEAERPQQIHIAHDAGERRPRLRRGSRLLRMLAHFFWARRTGRLI
jgi:hypothetical protein